MNLAKLKRRVWFRLAMRGSGQNNPFKQLSRLYMIRDPWNIDSPGERSRLEGTNAILERAFGRVGSVLEIGCGEGVQSAYLARLCDRLTGIDVVPRAIGRARRRLPGAEFIIGELRNQAWASEKGRYDVVVAAEVLNYMADPGEFVSTISRLARRGCLVTYMAMNEERLGPVVRTMPGVQTATISFGENNEKLPHVAWWSVGGEASAG